MIAGYVWLRRRVRAALAYMDEYLELCAADEQAPSPLAEFCAGPALARVSLDLTVTWAMSAPTAHGPGLQIVDGSVVMRAGRVVRYEIAELLASGQVLHAVISGSADDELMIDDLGIGRAHAGGDPLERPRSG